MLSIFDIYKIGVGPSSSHTNGPMSAGFKFCQLIKPQLDQVSSIQIDLYGSLSLTGRGHHTDRATLLGLMALEPETIDIPKANIALNTIKTEHRLNVGGCHEIIFDPKTQIVFHEHNLPLHENGMQLTAFAANNEIISQETYYSIGGGFVVTAEEFNCDTQVSSKAVPYPFKTASQLVALANKNGLSIHSLVKQNEIALTSSAQLAAKVKQTWRIIEQGIERGIATEGVLDGGLGVVRRAPLLYKQLQANRALENDPMNVIDWVNLYAFAVAEENAAGGQVVTSPTNGAAGVVPAVLKYYDQCIHPLNDDMLENFFAVSGAIGILYKTNASISGAEVGCQGEIGVAASMAAAGLTSLLGGSNEDICVAAEIAMEHSLGMTCDPINGLVQVPCIERNAMNAIKAINASRMALRRTTKTLISLDEVIETMYQTGKDMHKKYRETSQGGLAIIYKTPPCE